MSRKPLGPIIKTATAIGLGALALGGGALFAITKTYPAPLQYLEAEGIEIVDKFEAPGSLSGYVGRARGQAVEIYLTADGKHAIVGTMVDGAGKRVAASELSKVTADSIDWDALAKTHWIAEGDPNPEHIVYAFTDPNCPYCAMFWQESQPYLEQSRVQVRHIMVGFLRPSSEPKAATILAADNPAEALARHENSFKQGGTPEDKNVNQKFVEQVRENTRFMKSNDIFATPTIIFKDTNGRVQQKQGMPSESLMKTQIFR